VCGNGVVDGAEQCDGGECCSSACTFKAATIECRALSLIACDTRELCTGASATCPADVQVQADRCGVCGGDGSTCTATNTTATASPSTSAIVGGVLGGILLMMCCLLLGVCVVLRQRRRHSNSSRDDAAAEMRTARVESASDRSPQSSASPLISLQKADASSGDDESSTLPTAAVTAAPIVTNQPLTGSGSGSAIRPASDAWRIKASDITIGKQLGSGAFGVVWRGSWHHKRVAVKQLKLDSSSAAGGEAGGRRNAKAMIEFANEIGRMSSMQPHENIVLFYGVTTLANGDMAAGGRVLRTTARASTRSTAPSGASGPTSS
jgi:hypothetical protein